MLGNGVRFKHRRLDASIHIRPSSLSSRKFTMVRNVDGLMVQGGLIHRLLSVLPVTNDARLALIVQIRYFFVSDVG